MQVEKCRKVYRCLLRFWQVCGATGSFAMKDGSSKDVPIVSNPTKAVGKILVVDDDAAMRETLRDLLEAEGYAIAEAPDGGGMQACLEREAIDLITLDLRLGREDGLVLARDVRSHSNVPIIMISGRDETIDRVLGLELGADDYISKPFHAREVLARVRAVLRRYSASLDARSGAEATCRSNEKFTFDGWMVDLGRRELRSPTGGQIALTAAEFDLLALFARRPHRVLTRETILDLLKGHAWSPLDRTVDGLIARLRKKLEEDTANPRLVKTVRGIGYVFVSDVQAA
jgi:DNA-binding response OmpR family regulator